MKKRLICLFTAICICINSFAQKSPAPFVNGDRVVFAGNSITEAGFYETYIWLYYITHFPKKKLQFLTVESAAMWQSKFIQDWTMMFLQ
jgi:hypothetical protein